MNRAFKSIWNAATGTFVAVAENVNSKGKRTSSARKAGILAALGGALALGSGAATAAITVDQTGNKIDFDAAGGAIDFGSGGSISGVNSITGLASLTVNGTLSATQIQVTGPVAAPAFNSTNVATSGQLFTEQGRITANKSSIDAMSTHEGRITTNTTNIADIDTALSNLGVNTSVQGIKYFRVNSSKGDANASGADSVAIGPLAESSGVNSLAAGLSAKASGENSVATGNEALASGKNSVASGNKAQATGENTVAVGNEALAKGKSNIALGDEAKVDDDDIKDATAIGSGATVTGNNSSSAMALGHNANASGSAATAIGKDANASGGNAIAFGSNATASGASGLALGQGAKALAEDNISIGRGAGVGTTATTAGDQKQNIAIGANSGSNVVGQTNTALGFNAGQNVKGNNNVAFGANAGVGVDGTENISIGLDANKGVTANRSVSIGQNSKALTEGVAIGFNTFSNSNGVALGNSAIAKDFGTALGQGANAQNDHVALGAGSVARQADVFGQSAFTNKTHTGSSVSVGSSVAGSTKTRRIVNVADGANATDAVNVGQLQSAFDQVTKGAIIDYDQLATKVGGNWSQQIADNKSKYVSINDGGVGKGNEDNSGALGLDSIAIGPDAKTTANASNSTAIGSGVSAEAESAVVLGHDIKGVGKNSTTIGNSGSEARDESSVAIGTKVISRDENSIVIGSGSETDRQGFGGPSVKNSIVIGTTSKSTAEEGIVLGKDSLVNASKGIAQGSNAQATAENAMAFGTTSRASAIDSQASGTEAKAYAERGIALGKGAVSGQANPQPGDEEHNRDSIAMGTGATAEMNSSIATGNLARATANFSQASGYLAQAMGINSIAQGTRAKTLAADGIALGRDSVSGASTAIAFGADANASQANSVALGSKSSTLTSATKENSATLNGLTYGGFAGQVTDPGMQVSVGSKGAERQIKHVGAGKISAESTDAINGSQLFATNTVLGNVANTTKTILGGNAKLDPNGSLIMTNIGNTGENTVHDAIKYAAQGWNVQTNGDTASNVAPGSTVQFKDGKNIKITRNGKDITVATADDVDFNTVKVDNTVTIGGDTNNQTVINKGDVTTKNLTVKGETRLGDNFIVNNDNSVTYKGTEIANKNDGLKFAGNKGTTIEKQLNQTLNIEGTLANADAASGANLRVDSKDGKLNLVMAKNLTDLESVKVGDTLIDNNGLTITGGPSVTKVGINANNTIIKNVAAGVDPTDAVNVSQLGKVSDVANAGWNVATSDTTGITTSNVAPTKSVDFVSADDSIVVEHTRDAVGNTSIDFTLGNNLNVGGLGKDGLPGKNGFIGVNGADGKTGVAIDGENGTIGLTGPTGASGTIGVINGTPGVDGKNGITRIVIEGNEVATMKDGLKFAGNKGATINKQLNETLSIEGGLANSAGASGANLRVDSKDGKLNLVMAKNLTDLNSITINKGGPIINVAGIDMNNKTISNLKDGVDGKDAVNVDQLDKVSEVANAGWNVATSNTTGITTSNVAPKATVDFVSSDKNVVIEHTRDANGNTSIDYKLNPNINLTKDGSVTTGNSVLNNAGLAVNDGSGNSAKVTTKGVEVEDEDGNSAIYAADQTVLSNGGLVTTINAGMLSVTNGVYTSTFGPTQIVAGGINSITMNGDAGTINGLTNKTFDPDNFTSGQAATEDQLKQVSDVANAGWNVSTNKGDVVANVGPSATVDFDNTDGNIAITQTGTDLEFNLNKDIDLGADGSVTTGNSVLDNDGLAVDDGAGNSTKVTTGGVEIADAAGNTTSIEAGGLTVSDGTNTSTFGPTQIVAGGANEVTIDGVTGTISGLTNKTFDPDNFTSGQAATEDQLKSVSDVANAGWNVTTNGDPLSKENVAPDATVDFNNTDGNIVIGQAGTNLEFNLSKDIDLGADGSVTTGDTVMNDNGVTIAGGPSITKTGIDAGDKKITSVAKGEISDTSTDAINGSQLNDTNNRVTVNEGNITNLQTGKEGMFQVSQDYNAPAPKPTGTKSVAGGAGAVASGNNSTAIGNDAQATANNSTSLGNSASASHNNSVALGYGSTTTRENSVSVGSVGNERQITNVARGEVSATSTDAINGSQLHELGGVVNQYFNATNKRIDRVDNNARAGIAGAVAAGTLPQSTLPGKSMLTLGGATYRGETALAIGVSRLSDNSRTVIKVNGTADSRGNASVGVGAGWHW